MPDEDGKMCPVGLVAWVDARETAYENGTGYDFRVVKYSCWSGGIARDRGAVPGVSCRVRRLCRDVRSAQLFLQMVPRPEDGQVNISNGTGGCDEGASTRSIWNLCMVG